MDEQKKIIIFDFDGTLYSGDHKFDLVEEKVNRNKRKFLPNLTDEQYEKVCDENPHWLKVFGGAEIVNVIYELKEKYKEYNISVDAFYQWQQDDIYDIVIDEELVANPNEIFNITQKYHCYIVSNSSPNHLEFYMKKLGINPSWFVKVISNRFEELDRTKEHYFKDIMIKENVRPGQVYVFGDSKISDILPAQNLNMNAYYIEDASKLVSICLNAIEIEIEKD